MRWVLAAMVFGISVAFLVMMIVLVPLPHDLFVPHYSPSQLSPYDHFKMAAAVVMMQITMPFTCVMILRSHAHCQRDTMSLLITMWLAELALATAHILHFRGFKFSLEVPSVLAGLTAVGLKLNHMLINMLKDCKEVLYIDFRISCLQKLLRIEVGVVILLVMLTLCDAVFETGDVLRVMGSIVAWVLISGGIHFACALGRELGRLSRTSESAKMTKDLAELSDVWRAISKIRLYNRIVLLHCVLKFLIITHVLLLRGYLWPFPSNLPEVAYDDWGMGFGVFLLVDPSAGPIFWYLGLYLGFLYVVGLHSVPATHARHQEEKLRVEKRERQQGLYSAVTDKGWVIVENHFRFFEYLNPIRNTNDHL